MLIKQEKPISKWLIFAIFVDNINLDIKEEIKIKELTLSKAGK